MLSMHCGLQQVRSQSQSIRHNISVFLYFDKGTFNINFFFESVNIDKEEELM